MSTASDTLPGRGLMQSRDEWGARNRVLGAALCALVNDHVSPSAERGLDVGSRDSTLPNMLIAGTRLRWWGIDPIFTEPSMSSGGALLQPGWAHAIPFADASFDCVVLANVYEHIVPELRKPSLQDIKRVLRPGGVLVGQLPNPYFPIESHSRLPFMGWLPRRAQKVYFRLSPVPWEHDFYTVTCRNLQTTAELVGFRSVMIRNFHYPVEAIPRSVRWAAELARRPPFCILPWAWQFVLQRPLEG
jgi:SAM-dependent methyltransferase